MTQSEELLLKRVEEAGKEGLFVGLMSPDTEDAHALVRSGVCDWRVERETTEEGEFDDYFLVKRGV